MWSLLRKGLFPSRGGLMCRSLRRDDNAQNLKSSLRKRGEFWIYLTKSIRLGYWLWRTGLRRNRPAHLDFSPSALKKIDHLLPPSSLIYRLHLVACSQTLRLRTNSRQAVRQDWIMLASLPRQLRLPLRKNLRQGKNSTPPREWISLTLRSLRHCSWKRNRPSNSATNSPKETSMPILWRMRMANLGRKPGPKINYSGRSRISVNQQVRLPPSGGTLLKKAKGKTISWSSQIVNQI